MLRLQKITLTHFKNYDFNSFEFEDRVTCLAGPNGVGKTNLLDAIYYCCFTKSYFSPQDSMNVAFGLEGFRVEAGFNLKDKTEKIISIYRGAGRKEFSLNDVPYQKLSSHIGLLPAVFIAPDDVNIITGNSELRRKFIDTILCQVNPEYLQQLMLYNKILLQRNSLLKSIPPGGKLDMALLEVLNMQLCEPGMFIFKERNKAMPGLLENVYHFYQLISGKKDSVSMQYDSQLEGTSLQELLKQHLSKDILLQRTTSGVHKDDIQFLLDGFNFKSIASQGQRKSLLFALKLSEYDWIKNIKGFAPLLLLDDIFEKLDEDRIQHLLGWVCKEAGAQVFISDTNPERLKNMFEKFNISPQIFLLK